MRPAIPSVAPIARVACDMAEHAAKRLAEGVNPETVALMRAADLRLTRWLVACSEMEGAR